MDDVGRGTSELQHRLIDSRFELLSTLGRGGMGVVYRAFDCERGVEVALKTLRGITPERILRFKTEFRALRDLRHPNLVELHELFEYDGNWYFTMEVINGVSFLDWVRGEGVAADSARSVTSTGGPATMTDEGATRVDAPMSVVARNAAAREVRLERLTMPACDVDRLRVALGGLARGLSALHAAGNVHRDVKPSNIMVDGGRVVLLDFGVVAEIHQAFQEALLFGTLTYMAPEQARGERVGPAADWYAVGVLLFQALTGRLPFVGSSREELLVLKQQAAPPGPSDVADGVPPELDRLVRSLLDRDARTRGNEASIFDALGTEADDEPWSPPRADDQLFVGRAPELAALDAALAASRSGAVCVLVEGESGVGKTAVVRRFAEGARAGEPRLIVLRGRCHEREHLPFNAVDGVIDDLTRFLMSRRDTSIERLIPTGVVDLVAVFPALRAVRALADAAAISPRVPGADVRGRAFAALRDLMTRIGKRRPVVVMIDDLQWADGDSGALLEELLRPRDAPALCLIATHRPGATADVAARLAACAADVRRITLAGLAAADAEALVRLVAPTDPAAAEVAHLIEETRGHPLFLRELVRQPATADRAQPARLEHAIWSRAERLDPGAQRLLAAVTVAGAPVPRTVAFAAAQLAPADGDVHVAELARENLVRVHGPRQQDAIEPFHDRVRDAVCAHQPAEYQRELHYALAAALEASSASAATLLARYDAAGDAARAAHHAVAAAEAALGAFAFGQAAELFRRALDAPGLTPERRCELLEQLAGALANDGRLADAAERYLEAAALAPADSDHQLDLLRRAAERFLMCGRLDAGLATARAVLARASMTLPTTRTRTVAGIVWNQLRMRGRALEWSPRQADAPRSLPADICWSVGAGLAMVDSLLGAYFSGRAARLALASGSPLQITRGVAAATIGASLLGRPARARRLLDAATRAAEEDGSPVAAWYVRMARTANLFLVDNDFPAARTSANELEREWYAAGGGPGWETDVAMHFSLASLQMLGEYSEMAGRVEVLVQDARRKGDLFQEVTLRVRFAIRHLLEDRAAQARDDVAGALAAWLPGTDSFGNQRAWGLWSRIRIALYAGELYSLERELGGEWRRMHRSLVGRIPVMRAEWYHAYGTYLLGRAIAARKHGRDSDHAALCREADAVADRLARIDLPAAPTAVLLLRAAVATVRRGPRDDVVAITRRAYDQAVSCGVHAFAPFVRRRLGEAIGGDEGAQLIAQGDADARRVGFANPERAAEIAIPTGRFTG